MASVYWPALVLVVPNDIVGIALGFSTSLQNLGLVIFPLIIAYIFNHFQSYQITILFFIFNLVISLGLSIFIDYDDFKYHNSVLNSVLPNDEISGKSASSKCPSSNSSSNTTAEYESVETNEKYDYDRECQEDEVKLMKIKQLI